MTYNRPSKREREERKSTPGQNTPRLNPTALRETVSSHWRDPNATAIH